MNADRESRYRAAEEGPWFSLGVAPSERRVRSPRIGTEVRVQVLGTGRPVLFVHGASTCGTSWAELAARLPGVQCLLLDRPGTGLSEPLDPPILDQTPGATGIVFGRAQVLEGLDPGDRMTVQAGSFFDGGVPTADAYLLSNIIHDWDADSATAILTAIRSAAKATSRLLLFEFIVPDDAGPFDATDIDVWMLALVSGRERRLAEYRTLLERTGWNLLQTIPTKSQTILEAATAEQGRARRAAGHARRGQASAARPVTGTRSSSPRQFLVEQHELGTGGKQPHQFWYVQ